VILLLNGAFGIGKTTVARELVRRIPDAILFDPEMIGLALQRTARAVGRTVDDFQDLRAWRQLTIVGLRIARLRWANIIVPMALSNPGYLEELRAGIARFEPRLRHVCLVAPIEVVHGRLTSRGADRKRNAWEFRRAAECCGVHGGERFATQIDAADRTPAEIAASVVGTIAP
jgi:predicted kinase